MPTIKRLRTGKCGGCGKKTMRTVKLAQTVNPLNKNAAGEPKTADEIRAELQAEMAERVKRPLRCASCEEGDRT